jgi:hypothetical protein
LTFEDGSWYSARRGLACSAERAEPVPQQNMVMEQTGILLGWSGEKSKLLASELRKWLLYVNHSLRPYFSDLDTGKGDEW